MLILCAYGTLAGASPAAGAVIPAPGWEIGMRSVPTNFSPSPSLGFPDGYLVKVTNSGDEWSNGSPVTIAVTLPAGVTPVQVSGVDMGPGIRDIYHEESHPAAIACVLASPTVTCTDHESIPPGDELFMSVTVSLAPSFVEGEQVQSSATVFGGGGTSVSTNKSTPISGAPAAFGFENFSVTSTGLTGSSDTQAGDHPFETTVTYNLNVNPENGAHSRPVEDPKDFVVDLPPGYVGNPQVVGKCSQEAAINEACPPSTQIGVAKLGLFAIAHNVPETQTVPIYNIVPDAGVAAQFAFRVGPVITTLYVNVSQETNYAVRVTVSGIPRAASVNSVSTTFFGEPLSDRNVYNKSVGASPLAFLQNPVDCSAGPLQARTSSDSWQKPGSYLPDGAPNLADPNWKSITTTMYPSMTGCEMLQFSPSLDVIPDTTQADEPTGVTVDVRVPQSPDAFPALATPALKNATVTLPAGLTLSPSAADGLTGCTDAQVAFESVESVACPDASVLGTAKIFTPLLPGPLEGQVYLGTPNCNPCTSADAADGNMLRIFLVAQGDGVRIKKEGKVYANPSTGQLTTTFTNNPALPFETLELKFKGGLRAGLATPQVCGTATSTSDFVPWSTPITPDANPTTSFNVDWNGNGAPCPTLAPLNPSFSAGTSNPNAGQFSPLTITFAREDREQDLSGIQVRTPPGLLGTLTGVPLCPEPQASLGTCAEASRIGTMTVAAGPGSHPFYEKGSLYLTGPYKGAPFGLSIVVPTVAGPFNLGNVVVRAQIDVDPHTTALTVTSDPFPQIIDGIPLRLRSANVTVERPGFIFNPTDCKQQHIEATISGANGTQTQVSVPFAVSGCAGLPFGPKFTASTSGKASRKNGTSLLVRLSYPKGAQSNIAKVKVDLPKQLPSRLTTLQKACPDYVFNADPAACPKGSIVGIAKAVSPVLPVPLSGPAYFVSHGGAEFPNLIVVLQGYGVRIDLVGDTFISKAGITSSTFTSVPDVQVDSFELYLPAGPDSALAANGNLCKSKLVMPSSFVAQDGAQLKQNTKIAVTGCPTTKVVKKTKTEEKANAARKASTTRRAGTGQGGLKQ
ncbi:MAG TPA: hypothetical protein VIJ50_14770 [Solirubrobacteraceae bacterium]